MANKKGDIGYVLNFWNCFENSYEVPKSGRLELVRTRIEVLSCGKSQMTLRRVETGKNTGRLHYPNTKIFESKEDTEGVLLEMKEEWRKKSVEFTNIRLNNFKESCENTTWCEEEKVKMVEFIKRIEADDIEMVIIDR